MKYAAIIDNVHEVALWGKANLIYWKNYLKTFDFCPYNENDSASVIISALNSKFKGIKFSEFSASLKISFSKEGSTDDGYYLIQAYNSIRFFSWVERKIYKTPYYPGKIFLNNTIPAKLTLESGGSKLLESGMESDRTLIEEKQELLDCKIFIPGNGGRNYFHASLGGLTDTFNFTSGDTFIIAENAGGVWKLLIESDFTPIRWKIRNNAFHKKSKTFKR